MFCVYEGDAVTKIFKGEYKSSEGRFPAAHLKATIKDGTGPANVYFFEDRSKAGVDEFHNMGSVTSDAAPVDFTVIRTTTPSLKNLEALKRIQKAKVSQRRKSVSEDAIYWVDGSDTYVVDASDSSQDKLTRATVHGDEGGAANRKWSVVQETGVGGDTWTPARISLTMAKFKQMAVAVGDHVDACYDAEDTHHVAIDALSGQQAVADYDITTEFPATPIHPDNREA